MLAKDEQIIADDAEHFLRFSATDSYIDKDTKKPVYNCLIYDYDDGKQHYRITYQRKLDLSNKGKIGEITGIKRLFMWLIGLDSAYIRFSGEATVDMLANPSLYSLQQWKSGNAKRPGQKGKRCNPNSLQRLSLPIFNLFIMAFFFPL